MCLCVHFFAQPDLLSKTYIHCPQRRTQLLAIVGVDEEEDSGRRESSGAGSVNMLAVRDVEVALVSALEPDGVVSIDHQDEV